MAKAKKKYKQADMFAAGLKNPDEALCKTCHNDKSPTFKGFDFAKAKEKGGHKKFDLKYRE